MTAGAEGQPRIQDKLHPPVILCRFPLGHNEQTLTDLHGLVELLPVILPVGVLHVFHAQKQRCVLRMLLFKGGQRNAHLRERTVALFAVLQIERNAAFPMHSRHQILVHIIPVLAVVFEEILKVALLVDHQAVDAVFTQKLCYRLDALRPRVEMQFQPLHRCVPTKNRPSVPQPVCAPMTGPMKSSRTSVTPKRSLSSSLT